MRNAQKIIKPRAAAKPPEQIGEKMNFRNKSELIAFIKDQCGVELQEESGSLNDDPELLYTEIPRKYKNSVLSVLKKYGIETNEHLNGKFWLYLINDYNSEEEEEK